MSAGRDKVVPNKELTSLRRWYPIAIKETGGSICVDWRCAGDHRFTEPIFRNSLACMPRDIRRTGIESLAQFNQVDCIEPSAFIFHASRCGSTLVTQLLAMLSQCIVISEARVIEDSLNLCRRDTTGGQGDEVLQGVVRSMGQRRFEAEQHLFVKLDSWHITNLPLIRDAFPGTPLFFVYRSPHEILASHRRQRGIQMVPGLVDSQALGIDSQLADPTDLDGYCRTVLESFFQSAKLYAESDELLLINYRQLPELVWRQLVEFFSISLTPMELRFMMERASRHSKRPIDRFSGDPDQDATDVNASPISTLDNCYHELERHRLSQDWC